MKKHGIPLHAVIFAKKLAKKWATQARKGTMDSINSFHSLAPIGDDGEEEKVDIQIFSP